MAASSIKITISLSMTFPSTLLQSKLRKVYKNNTLVCAGTLSCLHSLLFLPPNIGAVKIHKSSH